MSVRLCPHCQVGLQAMNLLEDDPIETDMCPACRGLWFDKGELVAILEAVKEPGAEINRHLLTSLCERNVVADTVKYVRCPVCDVMMNRQCFGHRSGVVVDRCREHGVWLDGGELETLFEWVAAGGHVLNEKVAAERETLAKKRDEERRQRIAQIGPLEGNSLASSGLRGMPRTRFGLGGALGELIASFFDR